MNFRICALMLLAFNQLIFGADCIAHRGFADRFPENTLGAIADSWNYGADAVEVDVHVLADSELVLFHDREVRGRQLKALTYSELQGLVSGYHVPTLDEAFLAVPADKSIVLDIKSDADDILHPLVTLLQARFPSCGVVMQSSDLLLLIELKAQLSGDVSYQYLTKLNYRGAFLEPPTSAELIDQLKAAGISGISVKGRRFIDAEFVKAFEREGIRFYVWTINDPKRIRHYAALGVDGVITDNRFAINYLKAKDSSPSGI